MKEIYFYGSSFAAPNIVQALIDDRTVKNKCAGIACKHTERSHRPLAVMGRVDGLLMAL